MIDEEVKKDVDVEGWYNSRVQSSNAIDVMLLGICAYLGPCRPVPRKGAGRCGCYGGPGGRCKWDGLGRG